MGEYEWVQESEEIQDEERVEANEAVQYAVRNKDLKLLKFYNKYWTKSIQVFSLLTLVFFELSLYNHVFELLSREPSKGMQRLSNRELSQFVMLGGAAQEHFFRISADPQGKYDEAIEMNGNVPWKRKKSMEEVYDELLRNPGMFSMSYERVLMYQMENHDVCDKLTFYNTNAKTKVYYGGWYYSKGVPERTRRLIDSELSKAVERGEIDSILQHDDVNGTKKCGRSKPSINGLVYILPLIPLSISIIFMLFVRVVIIEPYVRWRRIHRS